jgi:hypothetical protein
MDFKNIDSKYLGVLTYILNEYTVDKAISSLESEERIKIEQLTNLGLQVIRCRESVASTRLRLIQMILTARSRSWSPEPYDTKLGQL